MGKCFSLAQDFVYVCVCVCVVSVSVLPRYVPVLGFPGGASGKESACNAGDLGLVPVLG